MVLDNNGVALKTTEEKVKSLALKAKVTWEQSSDDNDSQGGSDEDVDEEEEVKAFNLLAMNFRKGNSFKRANRYGNGANKFGKGRRNRFGNKGGEAQRKKGACYNCKIKGNFASECRKLKENKAFVREACSDSEDGDEALNDTTCLMAIDSQEVVSKPSCSNIDLNNIDLQKEKEELLKFNNDLTKTFKKILKEKCSLENENSKHSMLNKETMRIEESLNVTFDESLPEPKSSLSVEDDWIDKPIVQDLNGSPSLQVNVSDEGYPKSLREARGHLIEKLIGELNERTLSYKSKQA
nr:hypothetical protein [Tanacetum cinerariifolium]